MTTPDRPKAEVFLHVLAPGADRFTFQTYTDDPKKRDEHKARSNRDPLARIFHGSLDECWEILVRLSAAGAGIYVTINETDFRGRRATNIKRIRAFFSDLDGAPRDNLLRIALPPHFVTLTSPGRYQAFWIVADATVEQFKLIQQRLARLFDSDPAVCDLPRVMRLPGYPHQKDPTRPFLVIGEPVCSGPPYSVTDFLSALATGESKLKENGKVSQQQASGAAPKNSIEAMLGGIPAYLSARDSHRRIGDCLADLLGSAPPDMEQGFPDGHRTHELLRRAGWCLGTWNKSEDETIAACLDWNRHNTPPLAEEKVRSTVASIAKSEAEKREAKHSERQESAQGETNTDGKARERQESEQNETNADENARDPTQREKLILIGLDADLWCDADGNPFATVRVGGHQENLSVKSTAFRNLLTHRYGERYPMKVGGKTCPSAPSAQSLTEALGALTAKAARGAKHEPAVRLAGHGGLIYLDLGTPEWSAVEISVNGWQLVQTPPVRFIRPPGLRPLPVPTKGGKINELNRFLNVASADDFVLIVSWLLAGLRPIGPYVVLIINGEQGAGKTLACRVLRRLIDPNAAELRNDTRDERDLLLAARNGWIVGLDNLSYLRNDLSDAICRIATKGAFATRALYTNDEEFFLEVCRPVLLNGIPPLASRADLADRAIICVLPRMPDAMRRSEEDFWADFENAAPRILGALLDGVSGALRGYRSTKLKQSYRMLDFAAWADAGCRALGCPPETFEEAYDRSRRSACNDALDADPVASGVIELMSGRQEYENTATKLLSDLEALVLPSQRDKRWPKDATRLSGHLRRLPPLLRQHSIEIDFGDRTSDAARKRLITIKKVGGK